MVRNKCFRVATAVFPTPVSFRVEQSRSECSVTRQSSLASVAEWESEWTEWQWVSIHVMVIKWHANRAGNEILSSLKRRNNLETNRMP